MRYLLDTHAALWWWSDHAKLGQAGHAILVDVDAEIFVSAASAWEVATKYRSGKLPDIGDPVVNYRYHMDDSGFVSLAVTEGHAMLGGSFDSDHRDPFDRLIAAQAIVEQMVVVTRDPKIAAFGCAVIW